MTTIETTHDLEIVCPGMLAGVLDVLSIGKGDLRLTVGGDDPAEIAKAKQVITEMMRAGYGIFVEGDDGVLKRVKRFNAKHMTYVISELAPTGKVVEKKVPLAGSKAKAIGRTAGG